jgi:hypothetical protein
MSVFWSTAILLLALVGVQQSAATILDFRAADQVTKVSALRDITSARVNMSIAEVIVLVRTALQDPLADVRMNALGAVMGRAMAARWAGTSGPGMGPRPVPIIPAEWTGDQRTLRDALENDCLALVKSDPDDQVRYQALLTVVNLELPAQLYEPLTARIVGLLVDLYRHDPSARIRAEVVKTFRLMPNNTPEMRAVLRDALVDANASIRYEGLTGITPEATAASRRLSFDEARDTIVTALKNADPSIRLAAVQALNVFGASAAPYIETLERLSGNDQDAHVRASARLAIEAIRRATAGRGKPAVGVSHRDPQRCP